MSEEDVKLLEAVRNWRPPEKLHPIAMTTWHLYEGNGDKLPPPALQQVRDVLDAYGDDLTGLAEAMEGLVRFMLYVGDELEDKETGKQVADLMREYIHLYEPFWERVGEALNNVGEELRGSFQNFMDQELGDDRTAPVYGEAAPKGTVPLKDIAPPPGRPPPWAPKKK